ncbi:LADA_0G04126g1_1 [Lachancea dasiensis]|uniref:LADA_0G04126g1_1 n=1 Tax=Lachancea dasiensis TaxID=1072105 RepID=A0A1G4JRZ6_9SACH|nr:LADA_0G04126g1_1 [Lachancea dasiensis]
MFNSNASTSAPAGNGIGGSSLFGQNKPTGGGLFGQSNAQGQSGNLFGQAQPLNQTTGSLFGQNNQQGSTGGLFGNQNSQQGQAGGLFGGQNAQQGQSGGGLFGNQNAQQGQSSGGLFGSQNAQPSNNAFGQSSQSTNTFGQANANIGAKPPGSSGLFGQNAQTTNSGGMFGQNNNSTAGAAGGGLFGQNTNAGSSGGGLFGQNTNASTGSSGGGLFGAKPAISSSTNNAPSGGLFGNSSNTTNTSGGLFGNKAGGTGLFANSATNAAPASSGGLFGAKPTGSSLFGNNANNTLQPQMQMQPALQTLSQLPINPMTRVADLPPQIRQEIEQLDQYVQRQVAISHHLKADCEDHTELVQSIPRDIKYLQTVQSVTQQSLAQDLRKITGIKEITDQNMLDSQMFSTILHQLLSPGSKISSLELDKFFQDKIQLYRAKLDDYFNVLSDIESAVRGIERDMFGATNSDNSVSNYAGDNMGWKTGINAIVSTVLEEFELFMDMAERVAELHQRVKEINGGQKSSLVKT